MTRAATLFSGIGAPECAAPHWHWRFCAEIEKFPAAVHAARFPGVPNLGDVTAPDFVESARACGPIDAIVFGSPCQSFSVAGKRLGLDDPRGNLALVALEIARQLLPRWLVFENVPGLLSSDNGRDFGIFLRVMEQCGYLGTWRILDAQFAGVPQRRRRVFFVGYLGDWRPPVAVLFEPESLRGDSPPRREKGQSVAALTANGVGTCGADDNQGQAGHLIASTGQVAHCLNAGGMGRQDYETETLIAHALRAEGFDASEDGTGRGVPIIAFDCKSSHQAASSQATPTLRSMGHSGSHANAGGQIAVAFNLRGRDGGAMPETDDVASLRAATGGSSRSYIAQFDTAKAADGVSHADAQKTGPDQALRELRRAVGEEAFAKWGIGVLAAFRTPKVLRSKVHGGGVRRTNSRRRKLGDDALSCSQVDAAGAVLALWKAGCDGRAPRGWRPPKQLAAELVAHLSELPHQGASAAWFLLGLWRASEGLGLLREALSTLQEVWRPDGDQGQPAHSAFAVRRPTPKEAERLQGFPDDFTAVPHRNKPAADGPRYKALGNSMAVPVIGWILARIEMFDRLATEAAA